MCSSTNCSRTRSKPAARVPSNSSSKPCRAKRRSPMPAWPTRSSNGCSARHALRRSDKHGARVQRPLWASTGTKNPAYRDVLYIEELIGPNTVNTMPLKTLESFRDHGRVRLSVEENISQSQAVLAALGAAGIGYEQITSQLQEEGVQKFIDSFDKLFQCIEDKRK